jgi:hypothetical protein
LHLLERALDLPAKQLRQQFDYGRPPASSDRLLPAT